MAVQKYWTCASLLEQEEYSVIDFNKVMSISGTPKDIFLVTEKSLNFHYIYFFQKCVCFYRKPFSRVGPMRTWLK